MVFAFIGCNNIIDETSFTSLEEEVQEDLVQEDFQERFEETVASTLKDEKIGRRKSKRGETMKVEVGGKDLQPTVDSVDSVEKTVMLEISVYEEKPAPKEKIDILFYVGGKTENCLNSFSKEAKAEGFLRHLDVFDWNVAISPFPRKPGLTGLKKRHAHQGRGYDETDYFRIFEKADIKDAVLRKSDLKKSKRGMQKGEKIFIETLASGNFHNTLPVRDFMDGLEDVLSSKAFPREGAKLHVVVIDYEHFPYYTTEEWKDFYKKYPRLNIILLSSRRVNVSNFLHISEKSKYNFEWLPKCNRNGISQEVIEALLK